MSNPNWREKTGATPGKLVLVAVLAVVFVVVVVSRLKEFFPNSQQQPTETAQLNDPPRAAETKSKSKTTNTNKATEDTSTEKIERTWPVLSMEKILAHDPLAEPDWLTKARHTAPPIDEATRQAVRTEKKQKQQELLKQLREKGAQAIVLSGNEKRAAIGKQSVRVGETIAGLKITDITRKGIVLTERD